MDFIDDLQEVVHGHFKEPIVGPVKSKMAEIRHLENRYEVIFFLPRAIRFEFADWCAMTC